MLEGKRLGFRREERDPRVKSDLSKRCSSDLKGTWQLECSGNSREATFERVAAVFGSKLKIWAA